MSRTSQFQSTLPVWGGTPPARSTPGLVCDFNPPSPCGEGLCGYGSIAGELAFQSTLPVWGGTTTLQEANEAQQLFQSTLPVWGGTDGGAVHSLLALISIHPPRVGRDPDTRIIQHRGVISIHPPRVGRDSKSSQKFFVNFCARKQYYQNF